MLKAMKMNRKQVLSALGMFLVAGALSAATTGTEFSTLYTFVSEAATGYLGRSIAIVGGLIGLGMGAATGKALPAAIGVILAIFGAMGPTIIDGIFHTATV